MKPLALLFLAFAPLALRAETVELTLKETVRRAAAQNVESRAADERVAQALARLDPARGALTPQVGASLSATRQTRNLEAMGIPVPPTQDPVVGPFNTYDARLRLTQTLFDPAAARRLSAARRGQSLAEADRARARQDLMALAAAAYIEARRADDAARLAEKSFSLAQAKAALARTRAEAGAAAALDAEQAAQAAVQVEAALVSARLARDSARRGLLGILNLPDGTELRFGEDPAPSDEPGPGDNPDVRLAQERLESRRADLAAARGEEWPKASLAADYGVVGKELSGMKGTYTLGAQASWSFFDGKQREGRRAELESQTREAEARAGDAALRTGLDAAQAEESVRAARELLKARDADELLARRQAALARDRASTGAASEMDAREAELAGARARDDRDEAFALLQTADVRRRRAGGRMEEFLK